MTELEAKTSWLTKIGLGFRWRSDAAAKAEIERQLELAEKQQSRPDHEADRAPEQPFNSPGYHGGLNHTVSLVTDTRDTALLFAENIQRLPTPFVFGTLGHFFDSDEDFPRSSILHTKDRQAARTTSVAPKKAVMDDTRYFNKSGSTRFTSKDGTVDKIEDN